MQTAGGKLLKSAVLFARGGVGTTRPAIALCVLFSKRAQTWPGNEHEIILLFDLAAVAMQGCSGG